MRAPAKRTRSVDWPDACGEGGGGERNDGGVNPNRWFESDARVGSEAIAAQSKSAAAPLRATHSRSAEEFSLVAARPKRARRAPHKPQQALAMRNEAAPTGPLAGKSRRCAAHGSELALLQAKKKTNHSRF